MMKRILTIIALALCLSAGAQERTIHIITTGDLHGRWFPMDYDSPAKPRTNLMSVKNAVDRHRDDYGVENVILIDAGDALQGDNAAFYYNYVETKKPHLFPRMAKFIGYDFMVVGNHDLETGHPVYDRVAKEYKKLGIPFCAANALKEDGSCYFEEYAVLNKGGLKVLLVGFTNPNMRNWVSEDLIQGIEFKSLLPFVQEKVDAIKTKVKPDVTIVVTHSGTGRGKGEELENQGLDLFNSLSGVDVLVCAHDHKTYVALKENTCIVNGGARAGNVGHVIVNVDGNGRKIISAETIRLDKSDFNETMEKKFAKDYDIVRAFSRRPVGKLEMELWSGEAFFGEGAYTNLVHTVQLGCKEAQISFTAPLSFNSTVKKGQLIYNDMFTIYPFENTLNIIKMKGSEVKNFLEFSYELWIQEPGEHVLKIKNASDQRSGAEKWSFVERSYNFDSAAGINYTVDVTKPYGQRIAISSLADGTTFDPEAWYNVAVNSYRCNGGGGLMPKGAGITNVQERMVTRYPELREMVYKFIYDHGTVSSELINDKKVLGGWKFIPEDLCEPLLKKDRQLLFNGR